MAQSGGEDHPHSLNAEDVFGEEAEAAFRALTASPAAIQHEDSFVVSPTSGGGVDGNSFDFKEIDLKPERVSKTLLKMDDGEEVCVGRDSKIEDEDEDTDRVPAPEDRVKAYSAKRARMVVVYSAPSALEFRSQFVTRLLNDSPEVFFCPDAVCTAQKRVEEYCGGHPSSSLSNDVFAELWGKGHFFVTYKVPMRPPKEAPSSSSDLHSRPSGPGQGHGSPVRGASTPTSPASVDSDGQPRRRRLLPAVPGSASATPASPSPAPTPKAPRPVQIAVLKDSVNSGARVRERCVVLSLDQDAAISVAKNTEQFTMTFICLTVEKDEAPFSPEHTVILVLQEEAAYGRFRNAALVAASRPSSARTLRQGMVSQVALTARSEWETVATVALESSVDPDASFQATPLQPTEHVTFAEALAFFQSRQESLKQKFGMFQPLKKPGFFATKLKSSLAHERDIIYTMANTPFDNNEPLHFQVLQTIYKKLTGNVIDCPRYGSHWEAIGFQGTDPATDLRATGFLSLMQLLHLVNSPDLLPLAHQVYVLSNDETQNFPMAVLSINLTLMCLQALQCGTISKMCNKRQQVISCLNDVYVAALYHLYTVWKTGRKTIVDSGEVLKDLQDFITNNPRQLMAELQNYHTGRRGSSSV